MIRRLFPDIRISTLVLILTIVPVLTIGFLIGYYMTVARVSDLDEILQVRGDTLARHLAKESEFGIFAGDLDSLGNLAKNVLLVPDVYSVTVYDDRHRVLVEQKADQGKPDMELDADSRHELLRSFEVPVVRTGILDGSGEDIAFLENLPPENTTRSSASGDIIGWATVVMSEAATRSRQQAIVINSILIIVGGATLSALLALAIGRSITRPIALLSDAVNKLGAGDYSKRVSGLLTGEFGSLADGFNNMADQLEEDKRELEDRITSATEKIRATIDTLEEKNRELDSARIAAERAGEEKAKFLATMSHEIRTPLNAILGYAQFLGQTPLSRDQIEYLRTVSFASSQLLSIIDAILDFSKISSGTVVLQAISFNLHDCFEDVITMLAHNAHQKGLDLALLYDSNVPDTIIGDPNRISQVLVNLTNNAIKFTDSGHVHIQVSRKSVQTDQLEILVRVTDSGIGLRDDAKSEIFKSFTQANGSINRRHGGTGLGLAIVASLVELMRGQVGVDSELGRGASFWFTFRCPEPPPRVQVGVHEHLSGKCILLVEPCPFTRRALRNILIGWGVSVFTLTEHSRLAERLRPNESLPQSFDAIIFAVRLHEHESFEPGALVKNLRDITDVPVLFIVNRDEHDVPRYFEADSHAAFASKPIRRETLYRRLLEVTGEVGYTDSASVDSLPRVADDDCRGRRILVAEDNDLSRDLIAMILRRKGADVLVAADGEQALATLGREHVDLVLLDVHLPILDGIEVARRIRENASLSELPIIATTADVFANENDRLYSAGMNACLFKPIDEKKLCALIRQLVGSRADSHIARPTTTPASSGGESVDLKAHPLYDRLLREFVTLAKQIDSTLRDGKFSDLLQYVHQLHGVAALFRIQELTAAANAAEQHLKGEVDQDLLERQIATTDGIIAGILAEGGNRAPQDGLQGPSTSKNDSDTT